MSVHVTVREGFGLYVHVVSGSESVSSQALKEYSQELIGQLSSELSVLMFIDLKPVIFSSCG